jgi:hypothetical protein
MWNILTKKHYRLNISINVGIFLQLLKENNLVTNLILKLISGKRESHFNQITP